MSTSNQHNGSAPTESSPARQDEQYQGLQPGSHTDQKLRHASAHHLYMTSRRFFIGPIPEGWINGHRKSWYRSRLRFRNYTSQTLSFSADPVSSHYTQEEVGHAETTAHASDEDAVITLSNANGESTTEDETAEDTQESPEEPPGELRTLTHPTEETEAVESPSEGESSSEEDSDATPRASEQIGTRRDTDIYDTGTASTSFVTARENMASSVDTDRTTSTIRPNGPTSTQRPKSQRSQHLTIAGPSTLSPLTSRASAVPSEADSTTHLLKNKSTRPETTKRLKSKASGVSRSTLDQQEPQNEDDSETENSERNRAIQRKITQKMARFNLDDNVQHKQQRLRSRIAKTQGTISANRPRRHRVQDGEILKAEKMLVSVEETIQDTLPEDYSENDSLRMENRTVDKWREFLVVCRKGLTADCPFALQMYRTRVIPDAQSAQNKSKPYYEVPLNPKDTKVNLYSALDKTIVIWYPCRRGTKIYIIRPKSTVHATEWYTFVRQVLGWRHPSKLPINVPDLGVSLIFEHPFDQLEAQLGVKSDDHRHTAILRRAAGQDKLAASVIIRGCIETLEGRPEWSEVLKAWSKTEKMGLAWKRYDRLEWIFGANEENMYGTIAMQSTHELELRPRYHYPTAARRAGAKEVEPPPVEGFLIRLTSQKGLHQRMNKMFYKRLYFYSQDHFLLFCRPAKACPPTPPKLVPMEDSSIPTARQIMEEMPMSWDIEPYPIQDGEIAWLTNGNPEFVQRHDEEAYAQLQRNVHNIGQADGYIDLCKVREVRNMQPGSSPADPNVSEGPAVDFHPEPEDTRRDDGATREFEHDRTLELALENGLVIRLQAYDRATRDEWVKRLDALVKYWITRCFDDTAELKAMRQRNLKLLEIDEEMESIMGQFAQKWEVKKAETSPHLHNMCALSGCRPIKMSGQLYRKPRRHSTFAKCHVILTSGKLVIFRSTLRKRNGTEIPHIHQDHDATIDLSDCYIYSGLATEADLLYANQTFDSNNPGLRALPRVYLASDTFTSRDEDSAITFVIWQPLRKSYFRAEERGAKGQAKRTLRHVSALGKHGRTIVFKARSRVEKDRWVLSISSEIDRLQEEKQEDIRIVSL